jgi:hypothetical protein
MYSFIFLETGARGNIKIHVNDILSSIIPGSPYAEGQAEDPG